MEAERQKKEDEQEDAGEPFEIEYGKLPWPRGNIAAVWEWNYRRKPEFQELVMRALGDIHVPRITLFRIGDEIIRTIVWSDGIPVAIPDVADKILLSESQGNDMTIKGLVDLKGARPVMRRYGRRLDRVPATILVYEDLYDPPAEVREIFGAEDAMPLDDLDAMVEFDTLLDAETVADMREQLDPR